MEKGDIALYRRVCLCAGGPEPRVQVEQAAGTSNRETISASVPSVPTTPGPACHVKTCVSPVTFTHGDCTELLTREIREDLQANETLCFYLVICDMK